jgi:HK97 family phage major capsid protein
MAELIKARQLREQRFGIVKQTQDLVNKPTVTKEDRESAQRMLDEADGLKTQIDLMERADAADAEFRTAPPNAQPSNGGDPADPKKIQDRQAKAWSNYMRYGWAHKPTSSGHTILGINDEDRAIINSITRRQRDPEELRMINAELRSMGIPELRDMGSGGQGAYPGATTGFFVPVGFIDKVMEALKYYGPMLKGGPGDPTIFDTTTGQPLPFPTDNDTTVTGELIGEGQQVTTADVTLGQIILGAYKFSSKLVKVSIELLQDSAFDFDAYLVKKFGTRLGRVINTYTTTGTGTSQPTGLVTQATLGATAIGDSNNNGTSDSTNTIGSDDLINLEHSVDPLYRPGSKYMMHDSTLRFLKTIKDKYGRPLWLPGLAVGAPDTINSYGYEINNDMGTLQTQSSSPQVTVKSILFGQLPIFMIRRVKDLSVIRLEERFADYGQVAFLGFARLDSNLLDAGTHPVKYLANNF